MSTSEQRFMDGKVVAAGKALERSNFVSTCNLLSQYFKEKGNFKGLTREISGHLATIAKKEPSQITPSKTKDLKNNIEDLNLPPTQEAEESTPFSSSSKEAREIKAAQMTIFYDGKIWVFNGLPPEKAREVTQLASSGSSNCGKLKEDIQPQLEANDSVIPIARRSSLHRFLGKRKERAISRGPYAVEDAPGFCFKYDEQLELKL